MNKHKLKRKLKNSTIKSYSVIQICKHLDQFQLDHNVELYQFDFAYNAIYKKLYFGQDYIFIVKMNDKNKENIINILNDIYSLIYI